MSLVKFSKWARAIHVMLYFILYDRLPKKASLVSNGIQKIDLIISLHAIVFVLTILVVVVFWISTKKLSILFLHRFDSNLEYFRYKIQVQQQHEQALAKDFCWPDSFSDCTANLSRNHRPKNNFIYFLLLYKRRWMIGWSIISDSQVDQNVSF